MLNRLANLDLGNAKEVVRRGTDALGNRNDENEG